MATALNRRLGPVYWPPSLLNLPAGYKPLRWYAEQYGFRSDPSDRYRKPLYYSSRKVLESEIVRPMEPQYHTYYPNPFDGLVPRGEYEGPYGPHVTIASNKAWAKLMDRVKGDTAALAVSSLECRETFEMVALRAGGLYRAYKTLRKGDFRGFLRELSVDPKRKHKSLVRTTALEASGLWLEYWFGWSPTVNDIGTGLLALENNPVLATVREFGVGVCPLFYKSNSYGDGRTGDGYQRRMSSSGKVIVKQGATFKLENKNLFLANRLGFVNPVSIAWELVPFSFVVDWFASVGAYVDGFTDLVGLSYTDAYTTTYEILDVVGEYGYFNHPTYRPAIAKWRMRRMSRYTVLTRPVPTYPRLLNFGNSKTRAATAVSLLTSLFLQGK